MCASTAAQYVALEALNSSFKDNFKEVHTMRDEYDKRRRYLVDRLNAMGLSCFEPRGAFYVFPCVKSTGMDGENLHMPCSTQRTLPLFRAAHSVIAAKILYE